MITQLFSTRDLPDKALAHLLEPKNKVPEDDQLFAYAMIRRREFYGHAVYGRGLIEFTNYCKNGCLYCGLRAQNSCIRRYRLTKFEILDCAREGYRLGFRTFVLQGGEDPWFDDDHMVDIVSALCDAFPDCCVTLSIGERSHESYKKLYEAGARRYLLRHETATAEHYAILHPDSMRLETRKQCLWDLKSIGYQVGSGFMVGSPGQTVEHLIADLRFLQSLQPDMIGIGPFLAQSQTPFANELSGNLWQTVRLVAVLRLMFPYALIPSTTALATLAPQGRELGLLAGANVVMPNLSPKHYRKDYAIYDDKAASGQEAAEARDALALAIKNLGLELVTDIGHVAQNH